MTKHPVSTIRQRIAIAVLIAALLGAGGYQIDKKTRPVLITGPMIQFPAPDTLVITWTSEAYFSKGWASLSWPGGRVEQDAVESRQNHYLVRFSDLQPGQTYSYAIFNKRFLGLSVSLAGSQKISTPAPRGRPFRFIAFGDSGNGSNTQAALAGLITQHHPDVVIHVGDLVYTAGAMKDYRQNFFLPNAELIRSVPFMASLGNHDVASNHGQPLLDVFALPTNGPKGIQPERNYFFDWGDARFVALDTNLTEANGVVSLEQMKSVIAPWIRKVFADSDARWKFTFFHHPYYTGSIHAPAETAYVKAAYARVFEESGVDVVFCGHNHLYERTSPIVNDKVVADGQGIVYITTGAGGNSRYPEDEPTPPYLRAFNDSVFSFTQVDLTADRLELKQIGEAGKVLDEYTITKTAVKDSAARSDNVTTQSNITH